MQGGLPAISGYTVTWQEDTSGSTPQSTTVDGSTTSVSLPASDFSPQNALYDIQVAAANGEGTGTATATSSPVSPVTTVSGNVVVLSSSTMSALSSDTPAASGSGSVLFWPAPVPAQVSALTDGNVLVANPGGAASQGLLDTVSSTSATSAGETVTTTPASLTDVFSTLALATTTDPVSGGQVVGASFRPAMAGIRDLGPVHQSATVSFSKTLSLGFDYKTGDETAGASISGELDVTPDLSLSISLDHGFADVPDGVGVSASASVSADAALTAEAHVSFKHTLGEIDGEPIDIQVGPVPIVIEPKVALSISVDGQIGMRLEATAKVGGSVSWNSNNPDMLTTKNLSQPLKVTAGPLPGKTTTGEISADLQVQPQLDLYDIGGPNLQADEKLDGEVNLSPPPGEPYLKVTPSLELSAGLDVDFLGYEASYEQEIASESFTPFEILNPPDATLTITPANPMVLPGNTVQLTSTRSDGQSGHPVIWTLDGAAGGDQISTSGLFTAANPPGRQVTVYATDDTGAVGEATIQIGTPFDTVSDLEAVQDSNDTGAQISCDAPDTIGGSSISSYLVTLDNGGPTLTTSGTSTTTPDLTPGITYTITVYPIDAAGQTGPAATTELQIYPPVRRHLHRRRRRHQLERSRELVSQCCPDKHRVGLH
jgi:hypothetical protein